MPVDSLHSPSYHNNRILKWGKRSSLISKNARKALETGLNEIYNEIKKLTVISKHFLSVHAPQNPKKATRKTKAPAMIAKLAGDCIPLSPSIVL